jgi:hypothetical protein
MDGRNLENEMKSANPVRSFQVWAIEQVSGHPVDAFMVGSYADFDVAKIHAQSFYMRNPIPHTIKLYEMVGGKAVKRIPIRP